MKHPDTALGMGKYSLKHGTVRASWVRDEGEVESGMDLTWSQRMGGGKGELWLVPWGEFLA